jgi:CRP-like cAMP-binding protein
MVPLRVANMIGCAFFAIFGALTGAVTTFLLYLLMIPINAYRLRQMLALVKKARTATQGDMSMEWLKPFMTDRKYRKGDILMKKGDAANEMLLTVTGKFRVIEINVELPPGRLMGELGFLTLDNRRTATIECIEDGRVLTISYEKLLEIYFQNPQFGYYFLVLTSQRLLENLARAEAIIAQNKIAPQPPFANCQRSGRLTPAVACSAVAVLIPTGFARMAQNLNSGIFPNGSSATLVSKLATVLPLILRLGGLEVRSLHAAFGHRR